MAIKDIMEEQKQQEIYFKTYNHDFYQKVRDGQFQDFGNTVPWPVIDKIKNGKLILQGLALTDVECTVLGNHIADQEVPLRVIEVNNCKLSVGKLLIAYEDPEK